MSPFQGGRLEYRRLDTSKLVLYYDGDSILTMPRHRGWRAYLRARGYRNSVIRRIARDARSPRWYMITGDRFALAT